MSHYTQVKTKITRKSCLLKALRNVGFAEQALEASDTPLVLKGYQGDDREQVAHIRIKGCGWGSGKNYVGGMSNDLGFERMSDGSWAFHVSEYDKAKYNEKWQNNLMDQYSLEVVKEVAREQNFFVESITTENNSIRIRLNSSF